MSVANYVQDPDLFGDAIGDEGGQPKACEMLLGTHLSI